MREQNEAATQATGKFVMAVLNNKQLYNPPSATVREGGREKWLACTWTPSRLESKMAPVRLFTRFIKA